MWRVVLPRATIEVHHFSFWYYPSIWELETALSQSLIWRKSKPFTGWKIPRPGYQTRITRKKWSISDDFGHKEPRHDEKNSHEKRYLYRSVRLLLIEKNSLCLRRHSSYNIAPQAATLRRREKTNRLCRVEHASLDGLDISGKDAWRVLRER